MDQFWLWFTTGVQHILSLGGYDHILYIMVLCITFSAKEWKKLIVLITAFTIGHSITLLISVLHIISIKQAYIEVLIPLTILITCAINIKFRKSFDHHQRGENNGYKFIYILALLFGFIHGMGFSYLLKSMLGKEESLAPPLLAFNIGLEVGQLIIVLFMIIMSVFLSKFTRIKRSDFIFFTSSAVFGIATLLFFQRLNEL